MGKFDHIIRKKEALFQGFAQASSYVPASGLAIMGVHIASGYAQTGRMDLLVGGSLLALLGVGIADITSGNNYLSKAFNWMAAPFNKQKDLISQVDVLTISGVGSCLVLGGGEIAAYLQAVADPSFIDFTKSASFPKVVANVLPFMAVSLAEMPAVAKDLKQYVPDAFLKVAKMSLNSVGCYFIYDFARKADLPITEVTALLQATTVGLGTLFQGYLTHSTFLEGLPDMTGEEKARFFSQLSKAGQEEEFFAEYHQMLLDRGFITEEDLAEHQAWMRRISEKYEACLKAVDEWAENGMRGPHPRPGDFTQPHI